MKIAIFCSLWILHICNVTSLKIMVIPINMGSHIQFMGNIAAALAGENHNVSMYIPTNNKPPAGLDKRVKIVQYKGSGDVPAMNSVEVAEIETHLVLTESTIEWLNTMDEYQVYFVNELTSDCENLFADFASIQKEDFQIAIVDALAYNCYLNIPYKLGIPWIVVSVPLYLWLYRVPHLSSQYPTWSSVSSDQMNFWERLSGFGLDLFDHQYANYSDYHNKKFVPEKQPKSDAQLLSESAMYWYLYDISVGYPRPNMPNTLDVGDIMARPAQPLTKEYEDIMKSAKSVILVALGSHFDHIPDEWMQKFCDAFNSVKHTVIWKAKYKLPCTVNDNVFVKKWVPQNDLLGHQKVKLFITHCGLNSIAESLTHSKPMVGFPIANDQPYNARMMEEKGYGIQLSLKNFTSEELLTKIDTVLNDPLYKQNVEKGAKILLNKLETPGQRMSFWAEHAVKFGHDHLRTKAHELNLMQFLMIDIFLFFVVMFVAMLLILCCSCVCCIKCIRRCYRNCKCCSCACCYCIPCCKCCRRGQNKDKVKRD